MSKNTRNRILLTAVAALLLVVMTVGGTLAWLQDVTDEVQNTFTTTNVDITLTETDNDDEGSDALINEYEVVPGVNIAKDPTVTVIKGSEKSWVFVKVVLSRDFERYLGKEVDGGYAVEFDSSWHVLASASSTDATTGVKTVVLYQEVAEIARDGQDKVIKVLKDNTITVSSKLTNADMDALELLNPSMDITAYAIQYAGNEAVETAWANVKELSTQYTTGAAMTEGTTK